MTRQSLNVELGELKPLVLQAAKNQGKGTAAWVREVLSAAVQEQMDMPVPMARAAANRSRGSAVVHFTARLTHAESDALRAAAGAEGLSQAEYVARMAQGQVGATRVQLVASVQALADQLQAMQREVRRLEPEAAAQVDKVGRELRAAVKRTTALLAEVAATRRTRPR